MPVEGPLLLLGAVQSDVMTPDNTPPHFRDAGKGWDSVSVKLDDSLNQRSEEEQTVWMAQIQHELLCHYALEGDVIPVALGAMFSNKDSLKEHFDDNASEIQRIASRLTGCSEYRVYLSKSEISRNSPAPHGNYGRSFLLKKKELRDQRANQKVVQSDLVKHAHKGLDVAALAVQSRSPRDARRVGCWDILLRRSARDSMLQQLSALQGKAELAGCVFSVIGPLPPFSFIEGAA